MPPKIRELKAKLLKVGCDTRPGKGSHVVFRRDTPQGLKPRSF